MGSMSAMSRYSGFTIVELLIVVVVIAILAAISIVAYAGIQNRANDSAVQSDLRNIGSKIMEFQVTASRLPYSSSDFMPMGLAAARSSYGNHFTPGTSSGYNMAYCRDSSSSFVLVAASKSGNVYAYKDGSLTLGVGPMTTILTTCSNNGLSTTTAYSWFYSDGVWQSWIGG